MPLKELTLPTDVTNVDDTVRQLLDGLELDLSPAQPNPGPGRNAFGGFVDSLIPVGYDVDPYDEARRLSGAP